MNTKFLSILILACGLLLFSCGGNKKVVQNTAKDDGLITFQFFQINDVYEIAPLEKGTVGGMARVATLINQQKEINPNTLSVLAGDFLSPSLLGTIKVDGKRIKGEQMVDCMNEAGIDLVTFGNHEFDIKEHELQERINESEFKWLGTSVRYHNTKTKKTSKFYHETDQGVAYCPDTFIWEISDEDGTSIKVGMFGATLNVNPQPYVEYLDYTNMALEAVQELSTQTDVVIGLTHLSIDQDLELAEKLPQVPLLMGGHEHHHMKHKVGKCFVTKADANAKTAYIHTLTFNTKTRQTTVDSKLVPINDMVLKNPKVDQVVQKWKRVMDENISKIVSQPYAAIFTTKEPIEAREKVMRYEQVNSGRIINDAIYASAKNPLDCTFFNSGSVRVDDQLTGTLTAIDIFRMLPFGGEIVELDIRGDKLIEIMEESESKKGAGAYLQRNKIWYSDNAKAWVVRGNPIDKDKFYHVATTDFLMLGIDLESLKEGMDGIENVVRPDSGDKGDLRRNIVVAVVEHLKGQ